MSMKEIQHHIKNKQITKYINYMSKNSAKSNYEQLMAWLGTIKKPFIPKKEESSSKFSKADHYKSRGAK